MALRYMHGACRNWHAPFLELFQLGVQNAPGGGDGQDAKDAKDAKDGEDGKNGLFYVDSSKSIR